MKKNIHPETKTVKVQFSNGDIVDMYSTYSKDKIVLEVDPYNHPAWTGKMTGSSTNNKIKSFNKKFKDLQF